MQKSLTAPAALEQMKAGAVLQCARCGIILRMEDERIRVSGRSYFLAISQEDFLEVYGQETFDSRAEHIEFNEAKDEEYYAWREKKQ